MPALASHMSGLKRKLWLVLGLFLLSQVAGTLDLHTGHGLEPSIEAQPNQLVFPEACHPREVLHLEAAGPGQPVHPCALCLHLVRSAGAKRSSAPRLAPPAPVQIFGVASAPSPGGETRCVAASRAPPTA